MMAEVNVTLESLQILEKEILPRMRGGARSTITFTFCMT